MIRWNSLDITCKNEWAIFTHWISFTGPFRAIPWKIAKLEGSPTPWPLKVLKRSGPHKVKKEFRSEQEFNWFHSQILFNRVTSFFQYDPWCRYLLALPTALSAFVSLIPHLGSSILLFVSLSNFPVTPNPANLWNAFKEVATAASVRNSPVLGFSFFK